MVGPGGPAGPSSPAVLVPASREEGCSYLGLPDLGVAVVTAPAAAHMVAPLTTTANLVTAEGMNLGWMEWASHEQSCVWVSCCILLPPCPKCTITSTGDRPTLLGQEVGVLLIFYWYCSGCCVGNRLEGAECKKDYLGSYWNSLGKR